MNTARLLVAANGDQIIDMFDITPVEMTQLSVIPDKPCHSLPGLFTGHVISIDFGAPLQEVICLD